MTPKALVPALALAVGCVGAPRAQVRSVAPASAEELATEFRAWLDDGRTPARIIEFATEKLPSWKVIDPIAGDVVKVSAGDRLVFVNARRLAFFVVVGKQPIAEAGVRLIGAHIDTPAPRLDVRALTAAKQTEVTARAYGGVKMFQWLNRPLAIVGHVAKVGGEVVSISLGLDDEFAVFATKLSDGALTVITSSTPTKRARGKAGRAGKPAPVTLVSELGRRYGIDARDLEASELYLVPKMKSREVGLDRSLIGAHGQDDRVNSYAAWRAIADLDGTPEVTAVTMLVDREEVGSTGRSGARSLYLETVYAWLLRAQGHKATESVLGRAFSASVALSADTPACINPNWPEVHEATHGPKLGKGPAMFPFTGRGGKEGGSGAHAELVGSVLRSFERAGVRLQAAELGRVDEGGGGTIAKYLGHRGIDVVDVGICVLSMHSPLELSSKADLWAGYVGFRSWLKETR